MCLPFSYNFTLPVLPKAFAMPGPAPADGRAVVEARRPARGNPFPIKGIAPCASQERGSHRTAEPKTLEPPRAAACTGTAQAAAPCIGGQSKSIRTKTVRMLSCFTDTALKPRFPHWDACICFRRAHTSS